MKRYYCHCGNEIYFENSFCHACQSSLGFIPEQQIMLAVDKQIAYRACEHRTLLGCNWLVSQDDSNPQCRACRLTRTIPKLSITHNLQRWIKLEATKRRAFYMLLRLQLFIPDRAIGGKLSPLLFDFLEDRRSNRWSKLDMVYTGHASGVITINAAEADDSFRTAAQQKMKEAYRTLLGHFRHEMGHFYWMQLLDNAEDLVAFRELFGDERRDYQTALKYFYRHGPGLDWRNLHISAYASSHPLEDWAECWAHYLHIRETLETAVAFDLLAADALGDSFAKCLSVWRQFSVVLNSLNRSMGINDPYPFVINSSVERKLDFIEHWVKTIKHDEHPIL